MTQPYEGSLLHLSQSDSVQVFELCIHAKLILIDLTSSAAIIVTVR